MEVAGEGPMAPTELGADQEEAGAMALFLMEAEGGQQLSEEGATEEEEEEG
jgi:hypothetical protein